MPYEDAFALSCAKLKIMTHMISCSHSPTVGQVSNMCGHCVVHPWNLKWSRNQICMQLHTCNVLIHPRIKVTPCLSWVHFNGQIAPVQCRSNMSHPRSICGCVMQIHGLHLLFLKAHVSNVELPFARSHVTSVRKGRRQYTSPALDQRPQVKARAS